MPSIIRGQYCIRSASRREWSVLDSRILRCWQITALWNGCLGNWTDTDKNLLAVCVLKWHYKTVPPLNLDWVTHAIKITINTFYIKASICIYYYLDYLFVCLFVSSYHNKSSIYWTLTHLYHINSSAIFKSNKPVVFSRVRYFIQNIMTETWKCTEEWEWPMSFTHGKIISILWIITLIYTLLVIIQAQFLWHLRMITCQFRKTHAITHCCVVISVTREDKSTAAVGSCHPSVIFSPKGSRSIWMSEAEETTKPQQNRADGDDFCSCCGFWSSAWEKTKSSSRSGTISIPLIRMCFIWTVEKP